MIRYPDSCIYSVTPKLGRTGFEDNPTTAIVLYFFRTSRIASVVALVVGGRFSASPLGLASALSGSNTLIAPQARLCRRASKSPPPWPTNICHSLPPSPPKYESPPEIPSIPAAARSLPCAIDHRSAPSHPAPPR